MCDAAETSVEEGERPKRFCQTEGTLGALPTLPTVGTFQVRLLVPRPLFRGPTADGLGQGMSDLVGCHAPKRPGHGH